MKHVFLLRHAKTEKGTLTQDDKDRALTPEGRMDAENAGNFLKEQSFRPDIVLCSPATRTRETLQHLTRTCPIPSPTEYPDTLYLASSEQIFSLVQHLPETANSVLIVGHNPGLPQCMFIASEEKSGAAQSVMMQFSPCSMAQLSFDTNDWGECEPDSAATKRIYPTT